MADADEVKPDAPKPEEPPMKIEEVALDIQEGGAGVDLQRVRIDVDVPHLLA